MKFEKEAKAKVEEKSKPVIVEIQARKVNALQMRTSELRLIEDLMELLNHGSKFAEHCSIMTGIGGIEGIIILKSLLKGATLQPSESVLDGMLDEFSKSDADHLQILLIDYSDPVRESVEATIMAYMKSADNAFKPTARDLAESIHATVKPSVKVGSIEDLIASIEAKLFKGRK